MCIGNIYLDANLEGNDRGKMSVKRVHTTACWHIVGTQQIFTEKDGFTVEAENKE